MTRVYNRWSDLEDGLLLNYMLDGIQKGVKIGDLLEAFATTYGVTQGSVHNRWHKLSNENRAMVIVAKTYWRKWGRPEKLAREKAEREERERRERLRKEALEMRKQWREQKKQRASSTSFPTGLPPRPVDRGLYVKVDSQGLVVRVETGTE